MKIEIRLLGEFSIRIDGSRTSSLNASRYQALLAYLALHAPQQVQRSEVAFQLWPDSNEEQALTNLRKVLFRIKQSLPDVGLIFSDQHTLRLNLTADGQLDVMDFKSALDLAEQARYANDAEEEQVALENALSVYQGDLLPQFYDDWLDPERERLRDLVVQAADRLVALLEMRKYYRDAIKAAQRLLFIDRLREETHRSLIRLHALNGDRAAALNAYHSCASLLAKELGVEPDATTRELRDLLLKNYLNLPQVNTPDSRLTYSLVGRDQEWKTLLADWKEATNGNLHLTILNGESGIGKTRLAEELIQWLARQGMQVCSSACYPAEAQIPYAPATSWLRSIPLGNLDTQWKHELARLIPELQEEGAPPAPMAESWQKQVFFEAMARALSSHHEPVLLFLDDLHWCDSDTLEWMRYFMRFDRHTRVLVLATLRTEEISSNPGLQTLLLDLRAKDQMTEIELPRFSKEQTGHLGAQLLGNKLSESELALLFDESEGVPLFVVELARAGLHTDSAQKNEPGTRIQGALPPRLRAVLEGRLMRLSTPARTVAESAAVIGREFTLTLLRRISELDEGATIAALDELWRRRMVRERDGEMYDFSHDKLREATLAGLSPVRSSWLNQRAAEALEVDATEDNYVRIAVHFERANLLSKSANYYARAATRARNIFALHDALEHITRACLLEKNPAILSFFQEQRGDILQLLEHREEAYQAFSQALGLAAEHLQKARLERKQVTLSSRHEPEKARSHYQIALAELNQSKNEAGYWQEWIETQFTWIEACYWQHNAEGLDKLLQQTKEPIERYGNLLHKIQYGHFVISSAFVRERFLLNEDHMTIARENLSLAIESANPYRISNAFRFLGMVALCANQLDESEMAHRKAIQLCEKNSDYNSFLIARVYISFVHRRMQRTEDLRKDLQLLEETLRRTDKHPDYEAVVQAHKAWLAYCDGKTEQARQYAMAALEIWKPLSSPYPMQWSALSVLFALALDGEQLEETIRYAQAMLEPPQQRLLPEVESALHSALEVDSPIQNQNLNKFKEALAKVKLAGYL